MKHTSGSWEATPGRIVVGKRVENGSMDLICDLRTSPFRDDAPYNSLLIAAAPDLLEACKEALEFLNRHYEGIVIDAKDSLRLAIAKAEGEVDGNEKA